MSNHMRTVYCEDALEWLKNHTPQKGESMVASLPDISEFSNMPLENWKEWFVETATLIMSKTHDDGVVIFYQSDIKYQGEWVDKGYLVFKAAEALGLVLLWHKIVCRVSPGVATFGKPAYSHVLCFSKNVRLLDMAHSTPDVLPELGDKTWVRGMGLPTCQMIAKFICNEVGSRTIIHPFCGEGSILAAANFHQLSAVGIERSPKRAQKARELKVSLDGKFWEGI